MHSRKAAHLEAFYPLLIPIILLLLQLCLCSLRILRSGLAVRSSADR